MCRTKPGRPPRPRLNLVDRAGVARRPQFNPDKPLTLHLTRGPTQVRNHEFVDQLVGWTIRDGVAHVPEMRTQLVAARVVAEVLADAAEEPEIQNGRITEIAGPQDERLADAAAMLFTSRRDSFEIRDGRTPGDPRRTAYAEGAALPSPGATLVSPSFKEWLAATSR